MSRIDEEVFLAIQIETQRGVDQAEKIMAVDGIDGCWIGPYDYNTDNYLRELIESKNWEGLINSWKSNPHDVCSRTCGVGVKQKGSFENQWTKETELN